MFCQKCGAENKDDVKFCNSCGAPLVHIPAQSPTISKQQNDVIAAKIKTREEQIKGYWIGPVILFLIGVALLFYFWPIALIVLVIAIWWDSARYKEKKKLENEIKELKAESGAASSSPATPPTKAHGILFWGAVVICIIFVLIGAAVIAAFTFGIAGSTQTTSGPSSTGPQTPSAPQSTFANGDQAVLNKIIEMNNWMLPTIQVIGDSATSGDYIKMGLNAALLRQYIDKNIPEMKRLAEGATSKKAAAQEYIAFLENLRTSADLSLQATDKYNSGDIEGSTLSLNEGKSYIDQAMSHFDAMKSLSLKQESTQVPTTIQPPSPKYKVGDIAGPFGSIIIIYYNSFTDRYQYDTVYSSSKGWERTYPNYKYEDRTTLEANYPTLLDHIDPSKMITKFKDEESYQNWIDQTRDK